MTAAAYLPPVSRPPHDPFKYRLDWRAGWRGEAHGALTHNTGITPDDGALALLPEPGSGALLNDPSGNFGGLTSRDDIVVLAGGDVIKLDRTRGILLRFDACCCGFVDWPCFGRDPRDPRVPTGATGMTAGCGQIYIADASGKRVLVINSRSGVLRGEWKSPSVEGLVEWQPADVVVSGRSEVFVSDPANGGVHAFSPHGRHRRFFGNLGAVGSLAVDSCDRLYIRVEGEAHVLVVDASTGRVIEKPIRAEEVSSRFPCPPVFEPSCDPMATGAASAAAPALATEGTWVTEALDSEISRCVWHRVVLSGFVAAPAAVDVYALTSESVEPPDLLALEPLEAWRYSGTWTGAAAEEPAEREMDFLLLPPPGRYLWLKLVLRGDGVVTPRLCAVEVEFPRISLRRYLPAIFGAEPVSADFTDRWLAIFDRAFRDIETVIDHQAAYFDPLACPDSPRSRDFLSWLAQWVGVTIERNWPEARRRTYVKFAPRLYPWRGTVSGLRQTLYLFLGLERFLDYTPGRADCVPCASATPPGWRPPRLILEHFKLRNWMFLDHARLSDNARLWGERVVNRSRLGGASQFAVPDAPSGAQLGATRLNKTQDPCRDPFHVYAHKLSVFVPASCVRNASLARALKRLVALDKPVHVEAQVIPVEPRFRVGVQAMLGLDAVIGWRTPPVRLDDTALAHGTVLTSAIDRRPAFRVGDARVGEKTLLS